MSEMVERVAKAISEARCKGGDDARAAIAAMREPTEEMVAAGASAHTGYYDIGNADLLSAENACEIWQAMIDEMLK